MSEQAGVLASRYPKPATLRNGRECQLRPMSRADIESVLAFASNLDPDDLLYLRFNITERAVVEAWAQNIEDERTFTILALNGDRVVGEATLLHSTTSWTRHLGEIRMQVAPQVRQFGLARTLVTEIEWYARELNLQMLTARMTLDQEAAQKVFRQLGFQREAVLWDYVITADGKTRNLLVATKRF